MKYEKIKSERLTDGYRASEMQTWGSCPGLSDLWKQWSIHHTTSGCLFWCWSMIKRKFYILFPVFQVPDRIRPSLPQLNFKLLFKIPQPFTILYLYYIFKCVITTKFQLILYCPSYYALVTWIIKFIKAKEM